MIEKLKKCLDCETTIKNTSHRCIRCRNIKNSSVKNIPKLKETIKKTRIDELIFEEELLTLDDLILKLKNFDIKNFMGSGKNRSFIKNEPLIYFSINHHAKELTKNINYVNPCIVANYYIIVKGVESCSCFCGKSIKWSYANKEFMSSPECCNIPTNTLEKLILLYGEEGEELYKKRLNDRNDKARQESRLSLKWFKEKFGNDLGLTRYTEYWDYNFSQRTTNKFSKISQELFDNIIDLTDLDIDYVRYATFSDKGEFRINFNKEDKLIIGENRVTMFLDFRYKYKIIEFDGEYWHKDSKEEDIKRDLILISKGYQVLRIKEEDYKTNKLKEIDKCIEFLINP